MKFGEENCVVMRVEKGKLINSVTPLKINNLKKKLRIEWETYKYLGQDESITYSGVINKERVSSEYFTWVHKIWKSELSTFNKQSFAIPVLTPTFGILDWTHQNVKDIDIRTGKIFNMTSNFNWNSDIYYISPDRWEAEDQDPYKQHMIWELYHWNSISKIINHDHNYGKIVQKRDRKMHSSW